MNRHFTSRTDNLFRADRNTSPNCGPDALRNQRPPKRKIPSGVTPAVLYWIVAFILVAPLSISAESSATMKWARILLTVAACVFGVQSAQTRFFGNNVRALAAFIVLHVCGALWSSYPLDGVIWKSFFAFSAFAGVLLAVSLPDAASFTRTVRALGLVALVSAVLIAGIYLRDPEANQTLGRLSVMGMNANNIGQAATPMLLIAICLLATEASRFWRRLAIAAIVIATLVILGTGSRGALLACAAGGCVPFLRIFQGKNVAIVAAMLLFVAFGLAIFEPNGSVVYHEDSDSTVGVGRLDEEMTKDTRTSYWRYLWGRSLKSPFVGHGWFTAPQTPRSLNAMNIYLQVFYEEGVLGIFSLAWLVMVLLSSMRQTLAREKQLCLLKQGDASAMVASCLLIALLVHGLIESSTILGTTTNSMFFGFAVGLLDRYRAVYHHAGAKRPRVS